MSERPVFLTSDVHLGAVPPASERAFHRWLTAAGAQAGHVVVNGDLFDFWFEFRTGVPRGHERTLTLLSELVEGGVPVTLMGGNHDWWGGRYLTDEVGVRFHRTPQEMDLAGRRTLVAHGDGLGRGDLGYRLLKLMLRSRVTVAGFRLVSPELGARIAGRVSRTEERGHSGPNGPWDGSAATRPGVPTRAEVLERWARDRLAGDPRLDAVAVGHTHVPALIEVEPDRYVINSGDWVHHRSWVRLTRSRPPELLRWED